MLYIINIYYPTVHVVISGDSLYIYIENKLLHILDKLFYYITM